MPAPDTTRRLRSKILDQDLNSLRAMNVVEGYVTVRPDSAPEAVQQLYDEMVATHQKETELEARYRAAIDASRQAEWKFHTSVLSMRDSVRSQFGPDSNEAQAVGYKKKSERKRPQRVSSESKAS